MFLPIDTTQFVIILISLTLTVLIVILSIQVFHILKEVRTSFQKINRMLEDATRVSGAVGTTVEGMSGLVSGIRAGLSLVSSLRSKGEDNE